jgi:hypothetical protein
MRPVDAAKWPTSRTFSDADAPTGDGEGKGMAPRCFPAAPEFEHRTEQDVWDVLVDQLPDDAALLANLPFTDRKGDYEADLIVALPAAGIDAQSRLRIRSNSSRQRALVSPCASTGWPRNMPGKPLARSTTSALRSGSWAMSQSRLMELRTGPAALAIPPYVAAISP